MSLNLAEALQSVNKMQAAAKAQKKTDKLKSLDVMENMLRNSYGDFSKGRVSIQEGLATTDTIALIPKIIEGELREAAEPEYLATNFMKKVQVEGGNSLVYVIPVVGELHAYEVAEGGRYNEDSVEQTTVENARLEVRVKKVGLRVSITEEAIQDSSWDIYGINVRKMGQAMARYKEELCFNNFSMHGTPVFDNEARQQVEAAGTTGHGKDGAYNDTMTMEDFLEMMLALMGQGQNPTDVIMHPLTWVIFAKNSMIGNGVTYGAFGGQQVHPWGATQGTPGFAGLQADMGPQKFIMTPEQTQGRLPMPINVNFSQFVKFDKIKKRFDMYVVDRSNVGVIAQKENLSTENWSDPERDVRMLKVKERYGVGILDNGKGIAVARNLAVAPTYPVPPTVKLDVPFEKTGK